jgi:hypothetical protein
MKLWFVIKTTLCDLPFIRATFENKEDAYAFAKEEDTMPNGRPSVLVACCEVSKNVWGRLGLNEGKKWSDRREKDKRAD